MKKKLLTVGVTAMALMALAGCGSTASGKNKQENTGNLKIWTTKLKPATTIANVEDSPFHTGLEKATGIKVDWEFPSEGVDDSQAFNLMTSEKELPDIIQYSMTRDAETYMDDGLIQDLTELLPEKAPNYWKFLQEHPDFDRAMKTDDHKYFQFGFFREDVITATHMGPILRQDWLKEQNLEAPATIADWENVLKVFNDKYGAKLAFTTGRMNPGFSGAFGTYGTFNPAYVVDENGKIIMAQMQSEWKEYMTWIHKLYQEGLIDPDVLTLDEEGLKTKILNNKVGVTCTTAGTVTGYIESAQANGEKVEWAGVKYPDQVNGEKSKMIFNDTLDNVYGFVVTKNCTGKRLDEALKWLDWAYSEEGNRYWNYGTEGESYEMIDGKAQFTDKILKNELGTYEALEMYTAQAELGLGVQNKAVVEARMRPEAMAASEVWYNKNDDALNRTLPNSLKFTVEEGKEMATIQNNCDSYILENTLKFMTGERSLDEFDDFVNELKDQNIERAIEIRQGAYDQYLKR